MTQTVTLKKSFTHNGINYKEGEEFTGTPDEIALLVRQGFADAPEEKSEEKSEAPAAKSEPIYSGRKDKR